MADAKISQLLGAATPVAGTEVVPIVQSGSTKKVSVDNLTKGRTVNASSFDTDVAAAGVTLSGTTLAADGTDTNIDINITPKGTGEVNITKVDIDGGTIDGTTQATGTINGPIAVGGTWTAAAALTLPALTLGGTVTSNNQSFSGTIANLGTVTTADVNGGTIDGTVIGGSSAAAATVTSLTSAADNAISISGFHVRTKAGTLAPSGTPVTMFAVALGNFTGRAVRIAVFARLFSGGGGSRRFYRESLINETGGASLSETNLVDNQGSNGVVAFSLSGSTISVTLQSSVAGEDFEICLEILSRNPGTITVL
jgi:hypothetical protein